MALSCSDLMRGIRCSILGDPSILVTGLAYRSDQVVEGDVFFCIVGVKVDGHSFARDAIKRGARVIVCERPIYLADASQVTLVVVEDSRKAMALAAANFYNHPSRSFKLVGVTGTNGKTTVTYLVESVARTLGYSSGLIGTIGNAINGVMEKSLHTTPESVDLQRLLATYRDAGCEIVSMELSSHGLALKRPWGTTFAVTAFTNLTQDHLDYHHTFEEYFEAKAELFSSAYPAIRVINDSDGYGKRLIERCRSAGDEVITTGFDDQAMIHPITIEYESTQTRLELAIDGKTYKVTYPLIGSFNVENVLTAVGCLKGLGFDVPLCLEALRTAPQIPGRLERLDFSDQFHCNFYVDYAHSPDAMDKALESLRLISNQPIILIFGCEGDRDRDKRPMMGRSSLAADYVIVTSDEPHSEDPQAIIDAITPAMTGHEDRYEVIVDRREAIKRALTLAKPGDNLIITGHGHEDEIEIGDRVIPFNDRVVATEVANQLLATGYKVD